MNLITVRISKDNAKRLRSYIDSYNKVNPPLRFTDTLNWIVELSLDRLEPQLQRQTKKIANPVAEQ